jgi:hypothetical protein
MIDFEALNLRTGFCLFFGLAMLSSPTLARPSGPPRAVPPSFTEPVGVPHKHCAGSCISRGSLQWSCRAEQTCSLNCSTAPPDMGCLNQED